MRNAKLYLMALLVLTLPYFFLQAKAQGNVKFYIYGSRECSACRSTEDFLTALFGDNSVTFYELKGSTENADKFLKIYDCIGPNRAKYIPVVGVFVNNSLKSIVVGFRKKEFWKSVVEKPVKNGEVEVYWLGSSQPSSIKNATIILQLYTLFTKRGLAKLKGNVSIGNVSIVELVSVIVLSALADSINPCVLYIFTVLLIIASILKNKKRALSIGLFFILAVFMVYYLLGLGLVNVLSSSPYIKYVVGGLAFLLGSYLIYGGLREETVSLEPEFLRTSLVKKIRKVTSEPAAFIAGLISGLTLLPCSSGPYIVALTLLAQESTTMKLLFLALYNFIFVLPMIIILITLYFFSLTKWREFFFNKKRINILSLVEGIVLVTLGVFILLKI